MARPAACRTCSGCASSPRCCSVRSPWLHVRGLRSLGWSYNTSLCVALLISLVPSAQVIAGWAVGWPYAATALLAVGGFFTAEGALNVGLSAGAGRAAVQWAVASGLMVVSALIYQPSALFYVVPLAGALIVQRHRGISQTARWVGVHLGFIIATLGIAYCTMTALYAMGCVRKIRTHRVRASLGRKNCLVRARAVAERAQPVRVERRPSIASMRCISAVRPWSE